MVDDFLTENKAYLKKENKDETDSELPSDEDSEDNDC